MKKSLIVLIVFLFYVPLQAGWTPRTMVSDGLNEATRPAIAVDDVYFLVSGQPHVVWTQYEPSTNSYRTYYRKRSNIVGWGTIDACDVDNGMVLSSDIQTDPTITIYEQSPYIAFCQQKLSWFSSSPDPEVVPQREIIVNHPEYSHLHHASGLQLGTEKPFICWLECAAPENFNYKFMVLWSQKDKSGEQDNEKSIYYNYTKVMRNPIDRIAIDWGEQTAIVANGVTPLGIEDNPYAAVYVNDDDAADNIVFAVSDSGSIIKFAYIQNLPLIGVSHDWTCGEVPLGPGGAVANLASCSVEQPNPTGNPLAFHIVYRHFGMRSWEYITKKFSYEDEEWQWSQDEVVASACEDKSRPIIAVTNIGGINYRIIAYVDSNDDVRVQKKQLGTSNIQYFTLAKFGFHKNLHIGIDPTDGKPHVVYDEGLLGSTWKIYYTRYY